MNRVVVIPGGASGPALIACGSRGRLGAGVGASGWHVRCWPFGHFLRVCRLARLGGGRRRVYVGGRLSGNCPNGGESGDSRPGHGEAPRMARTLWCTCRTGRQVSRAANIANAVQEAVLVQSTTICRGKPIDCSQRWSSQWLAGARRLLVLPQRLATWGTRTPTPVLSLQLAHGRDSALRRAMLPWFVFHTFPTHCTSLPPAHTGGWAHGQKERSASSAQAWTVGLSGAHVWCLCFDLGPALLVDSSYRTRCGARSGTLCRRLERARPVATLEARGAPLLQARAPTCGRLL